MFSGSIEEVPTQSVESALRIGLELKLEATAGFEPANEGFANPCLTTWPRRLKVRPDTINLYFRALRQKYIPFKGANGAGNGIRTRDPNLGKVVLYH